MLMEVVGRRVLKSRCGRVGKGNKRQTYAWEVVGFV